MKKFNTVSLRATAFLFAFGLTGPMVVLAAGPASVNLGSAASFVVLAKSGISTTGATSITGDIGASPIAASGVTGFGLIMDVSNTFSTSPLVSGKIYASDYTLPTPTKMTTAVSDMQTAYTDAAGRTLPTATELGAGNIGGMTLAPGLYKWSSSLEIPTDVTLAGGANDVWIFQIAQNLTVSSAAHINLSGGAQAGNIFWQIAGQTTLGTTSVFNGNILDQSAIVLKTGSVLHGRALAQTAVTLDASAVTIASVVAPAPTPAPTPTPTPAPIQTLAPTPTSTQTTAQTPAPVQSTSTQSNGGFNGGGSVSPVVTQQQSDLSNLNAMGISVNSLIKLQCLTSMASQDPNATCKAVYYIGTDGKRHAFPNSKVYATWYSDFSQVKTMSAAQLATISLGANVTYKPGARMVKFVGSPKVYAVDKGGVLRWITSEAAAAALYGSTWNKNVDDINDAFYTNYRFGADISGLSNFNPMNVRASVSLPSDSVTM